MNGTVHIDDTELHAFLDGALDADRTRAVEARIGADPALAARVAAYRDDKAMLKRLYAKAAERPLPQEWLARIEAATGAAPAPRRPVRAWRMMGSIAAALLATIGLAGYLQMRPVSDGEIVQMALAARTGHAAIVAVPAGAATGRYDGLLRGAVALNVKVPDLSRMGYRLTGLRVAGKAAEMRYADHAGRLFTLYVRRSDGKPRFDQFERDGLRVCVWQDETLATVMAGNVSTAAMQRLASLAYTGLTI